MAVGCSTAGLIRELTSSSICMVFRLTHAVKAQRRKQRRTRRQRWRGGEEAPPPGGGGGGKHNEYLAMIAAHSGTAYPAGCTAGAASSWSRGQDAAESDGATLKQIWMGDRDLQMHSSQERGLATPLHGPAARKQATRASQCYRRTPHCCCKLMRC